MFFLFLLLHRNAEFRRKEDCLLSFVGDEEMGMVNNRELESGLKAMAEDFHLPGGDRSEKIAGVIRSPRRPQRKP